MASWLFELNEVTRRRLWLALGVIPLGTSKSSYEKDMLYLEFDERDVVLRFTNVTTVAGLLDGAAEWAVQGRWQCASAVIDGVRQSQESLRRLDITMRKDEFRSQKGNGILFDGSFSIHPGKDFANFMLIERSGSDQRKQANGIILYGGDTLEICYRVGGSLSSRPDRFESSPGSGNQWFLWRRVK